MPVKNEQVRVFLLSIQDSEKQLGEAHTADSKLSIYESLLKELIDAQQALREELKDDPVSIVFLIYKDSNEGIFQFLSQNLPLCFTFLRA